MPRGLKLLGGAFVVGTLNAVVFLVFEYLVNHGTQLIWYDIFRTDTYRWGVVPLAILLSLAYSVALRSFNQERAVKPHLDPIGGAKEEKVPTASLKSLGAVFIIGVTSLLAGASLGPEASLVAVSSGLGLWLAQKAGQNQAAKLLALASVGSLLVAFFGSLLPILIPLIMLYQKERRLVPAHALPPIVAGLATYASMNIFGHGQGFGEIPVAGRPEASDYLAAFVLGMLCIGIAMALHGTIRKLYEVVKRINGNYPWYGSAVAFGTILGGLYLIGGESVQFSGSTGTGILLKNSAEYGVAALAGLIIVKLLVTAWSLASGYRGGLIFPSVYVGVALSLLLRSVAGDLPEAGLMIGSIAGIFSAMTGSALISLIMVAGLLHLDFLGLAITGVAGTLASKFIIGKIGAGK